MHTEWTPTPGPELRRRRLALGAQQRDVASILGVTRIAVYRLERRPEVPYLVARRYLGALAEIAARLPRSVA
jgi:transcriptional regulator with XRE-family HTH domain